jgi:copper homeostasis protein
MEVTFHRAFDMTRNPIEALEEIINLKCHRILTSGQANNAIEGADLLTELVKIAGQRIIIMPGSGINLSNFNILTEKTKANEFHLSATRPFKSRMSFMKTGVSMAGKNANEFEIIQTDTDTVASICNLAKRLRI